MSLVVSRAAHCRVSWHGGAALSLFQRPARRAGWLETNFYAPIFTGEARDENWQTILAHDYTAPRHHISFGRAAGRRLRRNDVWILAVQVIACYGKIAIHPTPAATLAEFADLAAVGPVPGWSF
jgi:uncharacterized membrane protein